MENVSSTLYFCKVRNVKAPTRGTGCSAGIDFYIPEINDKLIIDIKGDYHIKDGAIMISPGGSVLIPSGIKVAFPQELAHTALIAANKSGVATKKGLQFTAQVVDSDYTGEIHIGLHNHTNNYVSLSCDEKVIQFILTPVILPDMKEVDLQTYEKMDVVVKSERGAGGFGSTDNK